MNRLKHDSQDAVNNAKQQNWTISLTIPDGSPAPHGRTPGGGCRDDRTRGGDFWGVSASGVFLLIGKHDPTYAEYRQRLIEKELLLL